MSKRWYYEACGVSPYLILAGVVIGLHGVYPFTIMQLGTRRLGILWPGVGLRLDVHMMG